MCRKRALQWVRKINFGSENTMGGACKFILDLEGFPNDKKLVILLENLHLCWESWRKGGRRGIYIKYIVNKYILLSGQLLSTFYESQYVLKTTVLNYVVKAGSLLSCLKGRRWESVEWNVIGLIPSLAMSLAKFS